MSRQNINPYQQEAEERWGNTDAFKESNERVKNFTEKDWSEIREVQDQNMKNLVELLTEGASVTDPRVQDEIKTHRGIINRFYDCTDEIYEGLADMYVTDERFAEHYREYHPDLPEFLSKAMKESIILE